MSNKHGFDKNKILFIDLSCQSIMEAEVDQSWRADYLGGRGINDYLLFNSQVFQNKIGPFEPENVIIFGTGILEGYRSKYTIPGACRLFVNSRNALSGGYGQSSSAGKFASAMREAGYDHIVISGRSTKQQYILIKDNTIELRDAESLKGLSTFDTSRKIKEELRTEDVYTCTIGPAGENLVRYALINVTNRYCGRCGMGAVLGSKNIKALAITSTTSKEPRENKESIEKTCSEIYSLLKADPGRKWIAEHGMAGTVISFDQAGIQGIKNIQGNHFDRIEELGPDKIARYYKKVLKCKNCPVDCDRLVEIPNGEPYGGTQVSSMQDTPAYNFIKFLIDDNNTIIKGFELCNAYGLDIQSWTGVTQWAIEAYERGILNREDTDKLDLRWGDGPLLLELIKRTAFREGNLGNMLAEGVYRASEKTGKRSKTFAMQLKKMEIDDELRTSMGWTLGILTDPRGPTHTLGSFIGEMGRLNAKDALRFYGSEKIADQYDYSTKPEIVVWRERLRIIEDCLGLCYFATVNSAPLLVEKYNMNTYSNIINLYTGLTLSNKELETIAERILTLQKCMNIIAGFGRNDDIPPDRFFEEIPAGPFKGKVLDREKIKEMIKKHDKLHGWHEETGIPEKETLKKLGLTKLEKYL